MLKLETGWHSLSYDALTAYVSIVFARYMLIAETRTDNGDRTGGEIFFLLCDELQDLSFQNAMMLMMQAVIEVTAEKFFLTKEKTEELMTEIISHFPTYLRERLLQS